MRKFTSMYITITFNAVQNADEIFGKTYSWIIDSL